MKDDMMCEGIGCGVGRQVRAGCFRSWKEQVLMECGLRPIRDVWTI